MDWKNSLKLKKINPQIKRERWERDIMYLITKAWLSLTDWLTLLYLSHVARSLNWGSKATKNANVKPEGAMRVRSTKLEGAKWLSNPEELWGSKATKNASAKHKA